MPNDLKGYLKTQKNKSNNKTNEQKAQEIAKEFAGKNSTQLNSEFQAKLALSKQNGTFNKEEMLSMLHSIKGNMSQTEFERISSIILNL